MNCEKLIITSLMQIAEQLYSNQLHFGEIVLDSGIDRGGGWRLARVSRFLCDIILG